MASTSSNTVFSPITGSPYTTLLQYVETRTISTGDDHTWNFGPVTFLTAFPSTVILVVSAGAFNSGDVQYSLSTDGATYSAPQDFTFGNMSAEVLDSTNLMYFRLIMTNTSGADVTVTSLNIVGSVDNEARYPVITNTNLTSKARTLVPAMIREYMTQINGGDGYYIKKGDRSDCDPGKAGKPIIYLYQFLPTNRLETDMSFYEMGFVVRVGLVALDNDKYEAEDTFMTMYAQFSEMDNMDILYHFTWEGVTYPGSNIASLGASRTETSGVTYIPDKKNQTRGSEFELRIYFPFEQTKAVF